MCDFLKESTKYRRPSQFAVFNLLICGSLKKLGLEMILKGFFYGTRCSLYIRGFSTRGNLVEDIYRELRGKPVSSQILLLSDNIA
jgi:hypothetical protein